MKNDKKVQDSKFHFILLKDIGHAVVKPNIHEKSIINVLENL
jgi:3-dehydroquinate synthetase